MITDESHQPYYICDADLNPELILSRYSYIRTPDDMQNANEPLSHACEQLIKVAKHMEIFKGMNADEILFISKDVEFIRYTQNELIFEEKTKGDSFYYILQGAVELSMSHVMESKRVTMLEQGQTFGEIAPVTSLERNATAMAFTQDVTLLKITPDLTSFKAAPDPYNIFYQNVIALLSKKIASTNLNSIRNS